MQYPKAIFLFDAARFREVVSGRERGPVASALRGVLQAIEYPYSWAMQRRNRDYDTGRRAVIKVGAPVASIGNLTLGGTGKTPMVEWVARWFQARGVRIALVSRGYKAAEAAAKNDEALELEHKLPGVPHLQNTDRVAAACRAVEQFQSEVILLDDGFQHRRIARDLDIVLVDALEPFGFGHVFPRGTLREPISGLSRAHAVVLTRADMVDELERARIRGIVERHAPLVRWAECRHAPQYLLSITGQQAVGGLRGKKVAAFCGIGNPAGFRHTLKQCGADIIASLELPDHCKYDVAQRQRLENWAASQQAELVVCTHKDFVKLSTDQLGGKPLRALVVGLEFIAGQNDVEQVLEPLLSKRRAVSK